MLSSWLISSVKISESVPERTRTLPPRAAQMSLSDLDHDLWSLHHVSRGSSRSLQPIKPHVNSSHLTFFLLIRGLDSVFCVFTDRPDCCINYAPYLWSSSDHFPSSQNHHCFFSPVTDWLIYIFYRLILQETQVRREAPVSDMFKCFVVQNVGHLIQMVLKWTQRQGKAEILDMFHSFLKN